MMVWSGRVSWIVEYVQYIICIENIERDHTYCSNSTLWIMMQYAYYVCTMCNEQFLCSLAKVKECVYESKNRFK